MKWLTIQLIKLNSNLPKNESHLRYHIRLFKDIGKFAYNLFTNTKKKTTIYMRLFDTLDPLSQIDLLKKSVQFAKRDIADNGNPTNRSVEDIASDYVWQDGVIIPDYTRIDIIVIPAWTGQVPIKLPRP